jgi:hypothetical protein
MGSGYNLYLASDFALVFELNHDVVLLHTKIATPQECFDLLKTSTKDPQPAHTYPSIDTDRTNAIEPAGATLANLLDALFTRSWDTYLAAKEEQARQLTLKEFVDPTLIESAAAPVAMDLDQITSDSPELAAFIADQVTKGTAKLRGHISQLQKQQPVRPPKNTRGTTPSGARHKKKKDAPKNKNPKGKNGPKAADAAKDTTNRSKTLGKRQPQKKNLRFKKNRSQRK